MPAEITWVEIVDSAVKIGLGALIGGIFTYITTRTAHSHESRKEYIKRKRDMLDRVVKDMDVFVEHLMDYWAVDSNILYKRIKSEQITKKG